MVGDVTVDDAIAAVASTFGALPARGPALTPPPGSESRRYPAGGGDIVQLHHSGPAEQALAYVGWPTTDAVGDRTAARQVSMLAEVVKLRVLDEIRERQALAYSPGVRSSASDVFPGYGSLSISAEISAEKSEAFYA